MELGNEGYHADYIQHNLSPICDIKRSIVREWSEAIESIEAVKQSIKLDLP